MKNKKIIHPLLVSALLFCFNMHLQAAVTCTPDPNSNINAVPVNINVDYATQIQPIFNNNCTGCHGGFGGLSLNVPSYANLVNKPSSNLNAGIDRVEPYNEGLSFLFKKINCTNASLSATYGSRMPVGSTLSVTEQALILDWIQQGARTTKISNSDYLFRSGFGRN